MSQLKKGAKDDGNDEESGKENKGNSYGVDERGDGDKDIGGNHKKSSANQNNDEGNDKEDGSDEEEKDDELNKDNNANGDGDGANGDGDDDKSGKDGGTDGSGEKDSSEEEETNDELDKENKANGEGDDGRRDGDNGSGDNHDKKSAKEGGYEKKPRPSVNKLVKPEKKTNLTRVCKTASQRFSGYDTSKTNENQNKEEKKDDCPIQLVRCVYQLCQNIPKNTELSNIGTEIVFQ